jgi:hypothetical protein
LLHLWPHNATYALLIIDLKYKVLVILVSI